MKTVNWVDYQNEKKCYKTSIVNEDVVCLVTAIAWVRVARNRNIVHNRTVKTVVSLTLYGPMKLRYNIPSYRHQKY